MPSDARAVGLLAYVLLGSALEWRLTILLGTNFAWYFRLQAYLGFRELENMFGVAQGPWASGLCPSGTCFTIEVDNLAWHLQASGLRGI